MTKENDEMIDRQIVRRGIRDTAIINAMRRVDRQEFVPESAKSYAFDDGPQSIGFGQTISQPFIVALMTKLLEVSKGDRILEIGVGSGYQTAVLLEIPAVVYGVERIGQLTIRASKNLSKYRGKFYLVTFDGTLGFPLKKEIEENYFDSCIVAAAAPKIPKALLRQIKPEGRIVMPLGERYVQDLVVVRKKKDGSISKEYVEGVRFVPLIGKEGY